jgi:hypothetical protein
MAYQCPKCGCTATATTYFHRCINRNWYVVVYSESTPTKSGRRDAPKPIRCPDGLLDCSDPSIRRDDPKLPPGCGAIIEPSQSYCFDCQKVVYKPPARRPAKRRQTRK